MAMAFVSSISLASPQLVSAKRSTNHTHHRISLSPSRTPWLRCGTRSRFVQHTGSEQQQKHATSAKAAPVVTMRAGAMTKAAAQGSILAIFSTIVGVCVLIGSVLYKIPQVVRVVRRKSAAGISILMYGLETLGTTFSAVYFARRAFPFSTYGETVFIMFQNVVLMALIVFYEKLPRRLAFLLGTLYAVMLLCLYSSVVPMKVLMALQVCSIPILNLARVPQILLNLRRKSTGELSPITLGLQLLGNVARIFTTLAQVGDLLMFAGICIATCFNATLFLQWIYYSRKTRKLQGQVGNA